MGLFSGASAGVKLDADSTGYRREIKRAQRETRKSFDDMKKQTGGLRRAFKGIAVGLGAGLAVGVGAIVKEGAQGLGDMSRLLGQTEAVVKSTGGAAGVSVKQIDMMSTAMERATGVQAESIIEGQNMLLTFTNIRNEAGKGNKVFNDATRVVNDMAVAMGSTPKQAALQLGKALNAPADGLKKLTRVGVSFTAEQEAQIEAMTKAGDVAGAQKVMIAELNREFGGSAKAFGESMPGQLAKAKNAFGEVSEVLVAFFLPAFTTGLEKVNMWIARLGVWAKTPDGKKTLTSLADGARRVGQALSTAGGWLVKVTQYMVKHRDIVIPLTAGLLGAVAAYKAFVIIASVVRFVKALTTAQIALNIAMIANPVGLVVAAIVGLGVALVVAYKKSDTFRGIIQKMNDWIKKAASAVWDMKEYLLLLAGPAGALVLAYRKSDRFKAIVQQVWSWLKKVGSVIKDAVLGAVDKLSGAMDSLQKKLKPVSDLLSKIGKFLGKIGDSAGGAAKAIGWAVGDDFEGFGAAFGLGSSALPRGVHSNLRPFASLATGAGLTITSGYRPGAVTADGNPSDHGRGKAIDVSGSMAGMMRVAQLATMLPNVKQVIYSPLGMSNSGGPFFPMPDGKTKRGHYNHVHIAAFRRGGRVPGGSHLVGDRIPAVLEPGEFVLNKRAVAGFEAQLGPLESWNHMAAGGRAGSRLTPAQMFARQLKRAAARAVVAADPVLGNFQARRQLGAAARAAAAAQKRIEAEKKVIAQLERERKGTKKDSDAREAVDKKLKQHRDALEKNRRALADSRSAQVTYADSVVSLRKQIEEERRAAAEEAEREREEAAQRVQDEARSSADRLLTLADAEANLAAARAEATATLDDDVAVAQRMLALAQQRAGEISAQLGRSDLTRDTRADLVNQLADATRAQTSLTERITELNQTISPSGGGGVQIDPEQMQQLIASNDAFLAGLRDALRSERSNITINPTFTAPQVGVNQFLETMRYKLTQVGAGGNL